VNPENWSRWFKTLRQPAAYRFGPESLLLPDAFGGIESVGQATSIVDIGCGSGVLGLTLARIWNTDMLWLVDVQQEMLEVAQQNAAIAEREATLVNADVRCWRPGRSFDVVVANPPFFAPGDGEESGDDVARFATHAYHGGAAAFLAAADALAHPEHGQILFLYPADSLPELLAAAGVQGLKPAEILLVYARHRGRPFRVWVRFARTDCALAVRSLSARTRR
jgi:tRNA1(Val) A37 N6-methylase TrmN6